jgi:hypothetical protein
MIIHTLHVCRPKATCTLHLPLLLLTHTLPPLPRRRPAPAHPEGVSAAGAAAATTPGPRPASCRPSVARPARPSRQARPLPSEFFRRWGAQTRSLPLRTVTLARRHAPRLTSHELSVSQLRLAAMHSPAAALRVHPESLSLPRPPAPPAPPLHPHRDGAPRGRAGSQAPAGGRAGRERARARESLSERSQRGALCHGAARRRGWDHRRARSGRWACGGGGRCPGATSGNLRALVLADAARSSPAGALFPLLVPPRATWSRLECFRRARWSAIASRF